MLLREARAAPVVEDDQPRGGTVSGVPRVVDPEPEAVVGVLPCRWNGPLRESDAPTSTGHPPPRPLEGTVGLVSVPAMGTQRIHAEVTDRIAPHGVDVVGVTRRVVVLHQQAMLSRLETSSAGVAVAPRLVQPFGVGAQSSLPEM